MDCAILKQAKENILSQASQIVELSSKLSDSFREATLLMSQAKGRVALCGMGKSGLIGQKISATLSSTGTPSYFVHAAEALHGDMGMLHHDDLLILISNSGETKEVKDMLVYAKSIHVKVIALIGNMSSSLAKNADIALDIGVSKEICPNNLAPTSSTLMTLCLGDALAVSIMNERNFTENDFARLHPGGSLGRKLLYRVSDYMITENLPIAGPECLVQEALLAMTSSRLGLCLIMDNDNLVGIITDGDLRRALQQEQNLLECSCETIMSEKPMTIYSDRKIVEAEKIFMNKKIKALAVLDPDSHKLIGVLDLFSIS